LKPANEIRFSRQTKVGKSTMILILSIGFKYAKRDISDVSILLRYPLYSALWVMACN